jgi:O-antigen/teichoic acid export membrane protein
VSTAISEQAAVQTPERAVPSLRSNFKWTFAGNAFYTICQWGMLSVLAKAGSPAIVGQFALALAIAAPVFMFTSLQLRAVQATDARSEFQFADYFTLRVLASLIGLLTVAAVAWFLPYDLATRLVVLLVGVSKAVEFLSDVIAGLLQKNERLDQVAISFIIRGGLSLAAFGLVFLRTRSLLAAVVALVLAWSAVFFFYDVGRALAVLSKGERLFLFRSKELRKLFAISLPLGVVMTLVSLNVNIPRYILVKYVGEADLGIFAALAYLLVASGLVSNALGQSASARLARMFAAGDLVCFRRTLYRLLGIGGAILVAGPAASSVLGRPLLRFMYGPEYAQYLPLFVVMTATAGLNAIDSFLTSGLNAARSYRVQAPIKALATITTVGLSLLAIPRYGLVGAASALFLSAGIFVALLSWKLRQVLRTGRP